MLLPPTTTLTRASPSQLARALQATAYSASTCYRTPSKPALPTPAGPAPARPVRAMASSSSSSPSRAHPRPPFRAFYLGPRGTYSHAVARTVFHATPASQPPTPGVPPFAPSAPHLAAAEAAAPGSAQPTGQDAERRRYTDGNGDVELVPCATITAALQAALDELRGGARAQASGSGSGQAETARLGSYAVLPIENSTFGPVLETLDALKRAGISVEPTAAAAAADVASSSDAAASSSQVPAPAPAPSIAGEYRLAVSHTLLAGPGTKRQLAKLAGRSGADVDDTELELNELAPVTKVLSHEQALGQCAHFLKAITPNAEQQAVSSTALAATMALEQDYSANGSAAVGAPKQNGSAISQTSSTSAPPLVAALCAELCAEVYGLSILRRHAEDQKDNTTRFIVVQLIARHLPPGIPQPDLSSVLRPFAGVPIYRGANA